MSKTNVPVMMYLPSETLDRFRRVARDMFPEDGENAPSLLLSMFVESISDPSQWCVFIPGLPAEAKQTWQSIANRMYDSVYDAAKVAPDMSVFGVYRSIFEEALKARRMDALDAVAVMILGGRYGQTEFKREKA